MPGKINTELIPSNTKLMVIDWDDTIVGTVEAKLRHHVHVAKQDFGIDLTHDVMKRGWGRPLHELIEEWYGVSYKDNEAYERVLNTIISYSEQFPKRSIPGVKKALHTAALRGIMLGVVTGAPRIDVQADFKHVRIDPDMFQFFQTADTPNITSQIRRYLIR